MSDVLSCLLFYFFLACLPVQKHTFYSMQIPQFCAYRNLIIACLQVAKIDVKQETPVDHGEVICFSIYSGPEADFGNGKSCIWVDLLDGGGRDLLNEFAPFFEDPSIKKVSPSSPFTTSFSCLQSFSYARFFLIRIIIIWLAVWRNGLADISLIICTSHYVIGARFKHWTCSWLCALVNFWITDFSHIMV